jgi:tetratricopeptide (TPR) repeat protein/DNA-binding winged helix-turn-helix (wHTH) protein
MKRQEKSRQNSFSLGENLVQLDHFLIHCADGTLPLSKLEADLLGQLALRPGQPVTKEALLKNVWGYSPKVVSRAPHFTVLRLRKKLEPDPSNPRYLKSVYGVGYALHEVIFTAQLTAPTAKSATDVFFGRETELKRILLALKNQTQAICIEGPGGFGKTRLAHEVLQRWSTDKSQKAYWINLSNCKSTTQFLHQVCKGLDVQSTAMDPEKALIQALPARGSTLMVLDQFEHLEIDTTGTLQRLLNAIPTLQVILTSQHNPQLNSACRIRLSSLKPKDAAALFWHTARREAGDTVETKALPLLLQKLDGSPLAIKLLAAQAQCMTVQELLADLEEKPNFQSIVQASWKLLTPLEQRALKALSPFNGSLDTAAALQLLARELTSSQPSARDLLNALVQKSVVESTLDNKSGNFRLLETLRTFAHQKVQPKETAQIAMAHCLTMASWSERMSELNARQGEAAVFMAFRGDLADLQKAHNHALNHCPDHSLSIAACTELFIKYHYTRDTRIALWTSTLRTLPEKDSPERLSALRHLGDAYRVANRFEKAESHLHLAIQGAEDLGLPLEKHKSQLTLGAVHVRQGQFESAKTISEKALKGATALENELLCMQAHANLGVIAMLMGALETAEGHYTPMHILARRRGDIWTEGLALSHLGNIALHHNRLDEAGARYSQAIQRLETHPDPLLKAVNLGNLGVIQMEKSAWTDAEEQLRRACQLFQELGDTQREGTYLINIALAHLAQNKALSALDVALESELLAQKGDQLCLAHIHAYLGGILNVLARTEDAEKQFGKARSVFEQLGSKDGLILTGICGGLPVDSVALAQASSQSSDIRIARLVFRQPAD